LADAARCARILARGNEVLSGGSVPHTHHGGCHCGAIRYRVDIDLSKQVMQCNCSICSRTGTLLSFVPVSAFTLEKGEASLTDYQFNKKILHHLFCNVCGVRSFVRGQGPNGPMVAINTRCLDDVDATTFKIQHFDGKSR
jgi:hypothetical protein